MCTLLMRILYMNTYIVNSHMYVCVYVCVSACMYVCMYVRTYATSSAVADRRETWTACRSLTVAAKSIAVKKKILFFGFRASGFLFLMLAGYIYIYI
jgi:hypothetical protein